MTFRPATGGPILVVTALASGLLLILGVFFLALGYQLRDRGPAHHVFYASGGFMLLLLVLSLNFRIKSYELASGQLLVRIGLAKKEFSLQQLQDVRLEERPFAGCRRDMGVGGLWSNSGTFTSPRWGQFLAYASDTSRGVLLSWPDKKVLVTPADASQFMEAVKANR